MRITMKIFNRNKEKDINKEQILEDIEQDDNIELAESIDNEVILMKLPNNFVVGYYEGMKVKGLKEYINGYVFKYFNAPNVTYYRIVKYNSGHIFEIHDGDPQTTYLKAIIESFNNGENTLFVKTQNRIAKIVKHIGKVDTYLLPESETMKHPNALLPEKGKMKPIITTGFGFISFGLAMAFMGVTSLFLSFLFKNILNKEQSLDVPKQLLESPASFIEKLPASTETSYVSKVWFENGKWEKTTKQIRTPEMVQRENVMRFMPKTNSYKDFVQKCFSKLNSFEGCDDDNVFLDKIILQPQDGINKVELKDGKINITLFDIKDASKELKIKLEPTFNNGLIMWNTYCSNTSLIPNCIPLNNNTIENKETSNNSDVMNALTEKEIEKGSVPEIKSPIIRNEAKKEIVEGFEESIIKSEIIDSTELKNIHPVEKTQIITPVKLIENKVMEMNKEFEQEQIIQELPKQELKVISKDVPETLDLNNLSENIIVE